MQWAAVRTNWFWMILPPHSCLLVVLLRIETWYGKASERRYLINIFLFFFWDKGYLSNCNCLKTSLIFSIGCNWPVLHFLAVKNLFKMFQQHLSISDSTSWHFSLCNVFFNSVTKKSFLNWIPIEDG
jgi:hypothetical protein